MTTSNEPLDRELTTQRRLRPSSMTQLVATFDGGGTLSDHPRHGPIRIDVEATNAGGELAKWFGDDWFTDLIHRFGDDFVTLHIAPTPDALLHPCVIYEAEMLRRVVPHWRVIITAYLSDVQTAEAVRGVAESPYHEVRFLDETRPTIMTGSRLGLDWSVTDLFGRIRREQGTSTGRVPVLVRLPSRNRIEDPEIEDNASDAPDASITAKSEL